VLTLIQNIKLVEQAFARETFGEGGYPSESESKSEEEFNE